MKKVFILFYAALVSIAIYGQNCPSSGNSINLSASPNTYYPGTTASVAVGATSIILGAAGTGSTPISTGDRVLIIQMQGAAYTNTNSAAYGANGTTGSGYLSNTSLLAGNMEFAVANSNVPLGGGTLALTAGTRHNYQNSNYTTSAGEYRYQVLRIGPAYDITLTANIAAPLWNGTTGGVLAIIASNNLNFNGKVVSAAGTGFRGGGGVALNGGTGGSNTDYRTLSTANGNAAKGEGIAGTPIFLNNNGVLLTGTSEGYPAGTMGRGAPGNAGGGGTDGNTGSNTENSGGGGGSNANTGGTGGNSWSSNIAIGGFGGAKFAEANASRVVMGGGGGAGVTNDGTGTPANGFASSGAEGGGIVIIVATSVTGTGTVNVSGASANNTVVNDGSGGGGAAGSAIIYAFSGSNGITVLAQGGNGGTNTGFDGGTGKNEAHGPGGGGSGGYIFSANPLNAASSVAGGIAGTTENQDFPGAPVVTTNYGAANGGAGVLITNAAISAAPYGIFACNNFILPVHLLQVSASVANDNAVIKWQVTNETDITHYTVERSLDGINFTPVGTVPSRNVGSSIGNYEFTNALHVVQTNVVFYRVVQTEAGGKQLFSKTVFVNVAKGKAYFALSPNPVVSNSSIVFYAARPYLATLQLTDMQGRQVWSKSVKAEQGNNSFTLDFTTLLAGQYILLLNTGSTTEQVKLIKE